MKYEDIDSGISANVEINMDKACPECGQMGVAGNGVCLKCLVKIVRNEPMKSVEGMKAQIQVLKTQENTRDKIMKATQNETAQIGHNSGGVSGERLRSFIKRIEKVEEDISASQDDRKEIYAESKSVGFDVKTIRQLVRLRKIELEKRREQEELLELYKSCLGM